MTITSRLLEDERSLIDSHSNHGIPLCCRKAKPFTKPPVSSHDTPPHQRNHPCPRLCSTLLTHLHDTSGPRVRPRLAKQCSRATYSLQLAQGGQAQPSDIIPRLKMPDLTSRKRESKEGPAEMQLGCVREHLLAILAEYAVSTTH